MRTVHPTSQVCHLWANKAQAHARNAGNTVYFDGKAIYSYGNHFPMACHHGEIVLINNATYSVTTTSHQSEVRSACRNLKSFDVKNVFAGDHYDADTNIRHHKENFEDYKNRVIQLGSKAKKARTNKDYYNSRMLETANEANDYAQTFGLTERIVIENLDELVNAKLRSDKELAQAEKRERENRIAKDLENIAKWVAGERDELPSRNLPVEFRLIGKIRVQTSHGAECHVEEAKGLYMRLVHHRGTNASHVVYPDAMGVGAFVVNVLKPDGSFRAGCHDVSWEAVERFAKKMNW